MCCLQELDRECGRVTGELETARSQLQQTADSEQQLRATLRDSDERLQELSRRLEDRYGGYQSPSTAPLNQLPTLAADTGHGCLANLVILVVAIHS